MTALEIYQASPIKRHRATNEQVICRRQQLFNIVAQADAGALTLADFLGREVRS